MSKKSLRIDGIDLSNYQTQSIDYAAAKKAGVKFVYHKATESTTFADPMYARRRTEAKAAGLRFGAYHFAQPAPGNAVAEAQWFLKHAQPVPGNLLPALDLETNPHNLSTAQLTAWAVSWWTTVQQALGIKTGVTYTHYDLTETANTLLWAPRYSNDNALPYVPKPWKHFDVRQFSDGKYGVPNSVPGVGHVDINHLRDGFLGLNRVGWERKLTIPAPKPVKSPVKPKHANLVIDSVPLHTEKPQWAAHAPAQVEAACKRGADLIGLTEFRTKTAEMRAVAQRHGYTVLGSHPDAHRQVAILVKPGIKVLATRSGVIENNYYIYATVDFHGSKVTLFYTHWETNNAVSAKQTHALIEKFAAAAQGSDHVFYAGDSNPSAPQGRAGSEPSTALKQAGFPTIWQELKKFPAHVGVNVIGRNVKDSKVTPVSGRLHAPLGSDHYPATAIYRIDVSS